MDISNIFVSVVLTLRNSEDFATELLEQVSKVLQENFRLYEIIVVDDGSDDRTLERIQAAQGRIKNIQLFCLPRRRGRDVAVVVGLDNAIGDFIVTMSPRVDPPELIPDMVRSALENQSEIVYALPEQPVNSTSAYHHLRRRFLNLVAQLNDLDMPLAMSTYRLFSRSVLNFMLSSEDRHRTVAVAQAMSGYKYQTISYRQAKRSGPTKRLADMSLMSRALDLVLSTSSRPLRLLTFASLSVAALNLVYSVFVIVTYFFKTDVAPGWASLSLQISGLMFLLFLVLAVMSEYLSRIIEMVNKRPLYHISREAQSAVMDYIDELNVEALDHKPGTAIGAERDSALGGTATDWRVDSRNRRLAQEPAAREPELEPAVKKGQKV